MSGIQAKKVANYVIMPGIIPRLKGLFTSGFGYIAFLMAQIYAMVRLLPANHAYLNPQNIGKFTIANVIAQAANNVTLKKENIDQIIIFSAILAGLVLLIVQFGMILFAIVFQPAMAFPGSPFPIGASIFRTNAPDLDIAFMLLDQVFGVGVDGAGNHFFNSCIAQRIQCGPNDTSTIAASYPWPFHNALHDLFRFYNTGILVVGALIFLYFIVIVVGETAVTGSPFGQRFQNVWVPLRLVTAVGLLIPLGYGFNSGQYITLFAAKVGSSFATNGWITYNNTIAGRVGSGANPTGETESLIGSPSPPDVTPIVEAMSLVHACAMAYWYTDDNQNASSPVPPNTAFAPVQPYFVKDAQSWMANTFTHRPVNAGTTYQAALNFYNDSDIIIRFGQYGGPTGGGPGGGPGGALTIEESRNEKGNVIPHCGDIRISVKQINTGAGANLGPVAVQEYYFEKIRDMWFTPSPAMRAFAFRFASLHLRRGEIGPCDPDERRPTSIPDNATGINGPAEPVCNDPPSVEWRTNEIQTERTPFNTRLQSIHTAYAANTNEIEMTNDILERGWAGAGIWYNTISRINGAYVEAVNDIPTFDQYPKVMEKTLEDRGTQEESVPAHKQYCPVHADGTPIRTINGGEKEVARVLCDVYQYWNEENKNPFNIEKILTGSVFEDTINLIFGTEPLSAMNGPNVKTHPLTQLSMLGKGLVDASIRNIAVSSVGSAVGGLSTAIDKIPRQFLEPAMKFILSTAFVGLTAGLVLYYIVPFLPFIYFYFAVASWVKSIFEAMVGVPLWALAHLRLDGEGLPGNSAANGYYLILEIFLRPILTVFGLVAATLIFTAQVRVLHFLWQIVTENLSGFDNDPLIAIAGEGRFAFKRDVIDQFFFNIIYAIIVYMMAIAAFKLIDKIPDNLLRWMGSSVSSFGDINQDSVDGLTRYAALGGATAGKDLAGGIHTLSSQSGTAVGGLFARLRGGV